MDPQELATAKVAVAMALALSIRETRPYHDRFNFSRRLPLFGFLTGQAGNDEIRNGNYGNDSC
jgi:hypothetical protein